MRQPLLRFLILATAVLLSASASAQQALGDVRIRLTRGEQSSWLDERGRIITHHHDLPPVGTSVMIPTPDKY